jgi:phosphohistidine swiveling domain-containing protein
MGRYVVGLGSRPSFRESVAGGKGAGLARLRRAGFRVPPGFVITTSVFRGALTAAVRRLVSEAGPPDLENLEALRNSFLFWDILPAHRRSILGAYRHLGGAVAVRSSMVGEDSEKASFAGQLDTVLDVNGEEELLAAVRKCLASAFGSRLWAYVYEKNGAPSGNLAMAVVVQSMVRPSVSGVAFSVDPMTGEPCVVIEAVPGPGEPLVQGRATPDRYRAGYHGDLTVSFTSGPSLLGGEEVRELAATVRAIAEKAGAPQDVEWALDPSGFAILQARPITTLPVRRVYSNRLVSDMAPGLVKPLLWSTKYQSIVRNVFAPVFDEILGPRGTDYSGLIAKFHSRIYADTTLFGELLSRAGLPPNFFEVIARDEPAAPRQVRFRPRMLPLAFRALRYALRRLAVERRARRFVEAQHRELEAFRTSDWATAADAVLLAQLDRLSELHGHSQWHMIHVGMNMLVRNRLLGRMLAKWAPGTVPADLLVGFGRRGTHLPYDGIGRLAANAREVEPRILAKLASGDGVDARSELQATPEGQALLAHFDAFMSRFGFLSANVNDFSEVPWIENPRLIWKTAARIALAHPTTLWNWAEARRHENLGRVRSGLSPLRRLLFGRLHDATARLMDLREKVSLLMTEESYLMRRASLALGAHLAARGVLDQREDVFYLYADELARILADPREASRAWGLVSARKAELAADAAMEPLEVFCSVAGAEPEASAPDPAPEAGSRGHFLPGIGSSTGISTGRARIVRDPFLVAERLEPTDILVVPFTDVGWTPILSGIGGIVAEKGGQLSHASIIARECGIPAVVSVPRATVLIHEGQIITVDGTAGRVYFRPAGRA